MALSKIPSAGFQDNVKFRNIIINGDMSQAQRGTSSTGITGGGYYTCDRFHINMNGLGTWTQSQSTDVPTAQGFAKSLKMDCTTANASPSADEYLVIETKFEGQNLQYIKKGTSSAKSLTLSFWIKSSKTGDFVAEIDDNDNSRHINKLYTINSANTWEKKIITYAGDTSGTLDNDANHSLRVMFWFGSGTTHTGSALQTSWGSQNNTGRADGCDNMADSTSNEFYITGVQLEAGDTASDFEFLPKAINKTLCERYFQIISGFGGGGASAGAAIQASVSFRTDMRAAPSIGVLNVAGNGLLKFTDGTSDFNPSSFSYANQNTQTNGFFGVFQNYSGTTSGNQYRRAFDDNDFVKLDAEL